MFSNFQKNRLKADAIPTIFDNLTEEVPLVEQCQVPLNDTLISDNTPSYLSTTNMSVTMSDKSTSSEIETSSLGVQTPKYLSANTPRKLKLHERLAEEIQLRREAEDREKELLHKVNTLSLQLADKYSIDYCLKVCKDNLKPTLFMLVNSQMKNLKKKNKRVKGIRMR
ncbi:uncharacterized protein LOC126549593 isoform X2 [Aphis gossypii]|uniref:uncharacterized protein LOC126549593 isoform X2 n=1 Tax=Aphis gossypii TaxID=80765 RepID=UPI002158C6B6|nr:uncharacterized protein LOC126549593 isoform X2 [Aphis gossypii]